MKDQGTHYILLTFFPLDYKKKHLWACDLGDTNTESFKDASTR